MISFYITLLEDSDDKAAFLKLYHTNLSILTRTGQQYFKEKSFVEDALQLTWESVAKNFTKILSLSCHETTPYLVTIMKNKCKDILRKEQKYTELFSDDEAVLDDEIDNTIHIQQEYQRLVALIRKMPDVYREVLERRLILEESNSEAAKNMGISEMLAAKRFSRGRALLIEKLLGGGDVS